VTPAHWIAVGAALGATAVLVGQLALRWWQRAHFAWQQLPWYYQAARFHAPRAYDARFLTAGLRTAETALVTHSPWGAARIAEVLAQVHVRVLPHEDCEEAREAKLKGYHGFRVTVGNTLWGLCHELAHLCEVHLEKEVDVGHITWSARGIWAAVAQYEASLAQEMNTWKS
jgi:hypothetical protein